MRMLNVLISGFVLVSFVFLIQVRAGDTSYEGDSDWRMYQYDAHHTGYNKNDQIALPLELKWQRRYQIDLFEFNPACIVGDRIIVTNRRRNSPVDPTLSIRCIDMYSGDIIWDWNFLDIHTIDPPTYWNGLVYCQTNYGGGSLNVFNISDGSLVWSNPYGSQWDKNLGPVVYEGLVLYMSGTYGGFTVADANTGEIFWIKPGGAYEMQAPSLFNNDVYIWRAGTIFNLSTITKELTWRNTISYPVHPEIGGGPALDTLERIVFLENQNFVVAVGMDSHEEIWKNDHPYPTLFSTGDFTIEMQGLTPAICEDRLYYINHDSLYCCNKFTGESMWKYGTSDQFWSPPVIANGLLFVASRDSTFAFDLSSEEKVWTFPVGGQILPFEKPQKSIQFQHNSSKLANVPVSKIESTSFQKANAFVGKNTQKSRIFSWLSYCNMEWKRL